MIRVLTSTQARHRTRLSSPGPLRLPFCSHTHPSPPSLATTHLFSISIISWPTYFRNISPTVGLWEIPFHTYTRLVTVVGSSCSQVLLSVAVPVGSQVTRRHKVPLPKADGLYPEFTARTVQAERGHGQQSVSGLSRTRGSPDAVWGPCH